MPDKNKGPMYRMPPNKRGYFAQHSEDNQPIPSDAALGMINGPLTAMQPKLTAELAKPV